jgi:hypothetical protein
MQAANGDGAGGGIARGGGQQRQRPAADLGDTDVVGEQAMGKGEQV